MKINRVILSSNNNPTYYHFWNPLAKVYKEKFGIQPTLVWMGTEEDLKECGIDTTLGDVIIQPHHPDYHIPWQTTWALFWATQFFKDDVCWIMGIDQVPLSRMFIDMVKPMDDNAYAMLIADAYEPNHWSKPGSASPTSYHVAKGETFYNIYTFHADFLKEAERLHQSGIMGFHESTEGRWGIDESYSSHKLREYLKEGGNIQSVNGFKQLERNRVECCRHIEAEYDVNRLQQGLYSESHLCRPFTNHVSYITNMFNNIADWR